MKSKFQPVNFQLKLISLENRNSKNKAGCPSLSSLLCLKRVD